MTALQILKQARELIARGWTRVWSATDRKGNCAYWASPQACRFCMQGAVLRALYDAGYREREIWAAGEKLLRLLTPWEARSVVSWQDAPGRKKSEVLARFDTVIARLESEASR